jgi:hypothetical protein
MKGNLIPHMEGRITQRVNVVQIMDVASGCVFEQVDHSPVNRVVIDPSPGDDGTFNKIHLCADSSTRRDADLISLCGIDVYQVKTRFVAPVHLDVMHMGVLGGKAHPGNMNRRGHGYKCASNIRFRTL